MPHAKGKNRKDLPPQRINHVENSVGKCRCRVCYTWKHYMSRKIAQINAYHAIEINKLKALTSGKQE